MNAHPFECSPWSKIVQSPVRELKMAVESKVYALGGSSARRGTNFQVSQFGFAQANLGHSLWQSKELPSLRRSDTKLRAERVTRRPLQEDSDSWQRTDKDGYGNEEEGASVWDSNAENVRRRPSRSKGMSYSSPEVDDAPSSSVRERNGMSGKSRWDSEANGRSGNSRWDSEANGRSGNSRWDSEGNGRSGNSRWDSEANNRSGGSRWDSETNDRSKSSMWGFDTNEGSENREWDYESEPGSAKPKRGWEWWFTDDDQEEEDEDYEEEDNLLNMDLKDAFMLLRWGLPAAFLLCTAVIPAMVGNPVLLLLGFSVFPTVVKFLSPIVKDFARSPANPFGSYSSTRTKSQRSQAASAYSRRSQDTAKYNDYGAPTQPISRSSDSGVSRPNATSKRSNPGDSDVSRQNFTLPRSNPGDSDVSRQSVTLRRSTLGGWDDLVEDRSRVEGERRWPLQRRTRSGKKLAKREKPFVIRILLAFFPFLRRWAGSL